MANMEVKSSFKGDAAVLEVSGSVDIDHGDELKGAIFNLIEKKNLNIVVDMSGVSYIDSSGLGILVGAVTHARRAGGNLKLANISPGVKEILNLTRLSSFFEIGYI